MMTSAERDDYIEKLHRSFRASRELHRREETKCSNISYASQYLSWLLKKLYPKQGFEWTLIERTVGAELELNSDGTESREEIKDFVEAVLEAWFKEFPVAGPPWLLERLDQRRKSEQRESRLFQAVRDPVEVGAPEEK